MRFVKYLLAAGAIVIATSCVPAVTPAAHAQVSVGIGIGAEPVCPYGYYGYAPYRCSPYGYYGPEWFHGGVFIGAGRWYRGDYHYFGAVNRSYDPRYGYHGAYPHPGPYREPADHWQNFHGNDYHNYAGNRESSYYHGEHR